MKSEEEAVKSLFAYAVAANLSEPVERQWKTIREVHKVINKSQMQKSTAFFNDGP